MQVDRVRARFGSWYELFPRSWGGLDGVREQLPAARRARLRRPLPAADPPDRPHAPQGPQQRARRRARTIPAARGRSARPRAATPRSTPTSARSRTSQALVADARGHGIEIALDLALQCSADHPWLAEHPDWFHRRPDGTLKYAENPPKRYQDIYNLNFDSPDWRALWRAIRDVVRHWIDRGVRIFRVDNPHTKPLGVLGVAARRRCARRDPDVVFLTEAFTRRAVMRELAKVGFQQSYTYFTWKSSRWDLTEYVTRAGDLR